MLKMMAFITKNPLHGTTCNAVYACYNTIDVERGGHNEYESRVGKLHLGRDYRPAKDIDKKRLFSAFGIWRGVMKKLIKGLLVATLLIFPFHSCMGEMVAISELVAQAEDLEWNQTYEAHGRTYCYSEYSKFTCYAGKRTNGD